MDSCIDKENDTVYENDGIQTLERLGRSITDSETMGKSIELKDSSIDKEGGSIGSV